MLAATTSSTARSAAASSLRRSALAAAPAGKRAFTTAKADQVNVAAVVSIISLIQKGNFARREEGRATESACE